MRRCNWCGVELRWWQVNHCRVCLRYLEMNYPSPPCPEGSRWGGLRDKFWGDYRAAMDSESK